MCYADNILNNMVASDDLFCRCILDDIILGVILSLKEDSLEECAINLLPYKFKLINQNINIPNIIENGIKESIDILAELLGCINYKTNLCEFWFLDMITKTLILAQTENVSQTAQKTMILWCCNLIKDIQMSTDSQKIVINRFKEMVLSVKISHDSVRLSANDTVPDISYDPAINKKQCEILNIEKTKYISTGYDTSSPEEKGLAMGLQNLLKITNSILEIFQDTFTFSLLRILFSKPLNYNQINWFYRLNVPKTLLSITEMQKFQEIMTSKSITSEDGTPKDPTEVLPMTNIENQKIETELQCEFKTQILPLQLAVDEKFFENLWGPERKMTQNTKIVSTKKGKKKKQ